MKNLFFSIVIPAHNEQEYIGETIDHIKNQNYPKEMYKTIIVENGSTDKTYKIAKEYESERIHILKTSKKGVSNARNIGSAKCDKKTDWIIFLDADTHLKEGFLSELNKFLIKKKGLSIGTTKILPINTTQKAIVFFKLLDVFHHFCNFSASIQIQSYKISKLVKYDNRMSVAEDTKFIKENMKHGKFFYMKTNSVFVSTRRLDKKGYIKMLYIWFVETFINKNKFNDYEVIR